jgi:hypothetical protein
MRRYRAVVGLVGLLCAVSGPSWAQGFQCTWAGVTGGVTSVPVGHWTRPDGYVRYSWTDSWDVKIDKLPALGSYATGSLISTGSGDYAGSTAVFFPAWPSIGVQWSGTLRFRWGLYRSGSYREDYRQDYTVVDGVVQMPTPVLGISGPASGWGSVTLTVTGNAYVTGPVALAYSGGASGPSSVVVSGSASVAVSLPRRVSSVSVTASYPGAAVVTHTVAVTLSGATLGQSVEAGAVGAAAELADTVAAVALPVFLVLAVGVLCVVVWRRVWLFVRGRSGGLAGAGGVACAGPGRGAAGAAASGQRGSGRVPAGAAASGQRGSGRGRRGSARVRR